LSISEKKYKPEVLAVPRTSKAPNLVPSDNFSLWKLLDHTRFMVSRSREMELGEFGLTPEQAHVLEILRQNAGKTTINDIVDITQRQHHSISTLINRMTKQGLVLKKKDLNDNRKYEVAITKKGKLLTTKMTTKSIEEVFACLSDVEKVELRKRLNCLLLKAYQVLGKEFVPMGRNSNK
jgi:DNA-binding MarR family transcriptional regulator